MDLGFLARHLAEDGPNIYEAMIGLSTHTDKVQKEEQELALGLVGPLLLFLRSPWVLSGPRWWTQVLQSEQNRQYIKIQKYY